MTYRLLLLWVILLWSVGMVRAQAPENVGNAAKDSGENGSAEEHQSSSSIKNVIKLDGEDANVPLYIKSDSLDLKAKDRVFTYRGNVEITRADVLITSDVVVGRYDEQNRIETIACEGNVVITRGSELRASSNRAMYRVKESIVEMTEGPELVRDGSALSADRVVIYIDEDRSEAEGDVRVKVLKTDEKVDILGGLGGVEEDEMAVEEQGEQEEGL